MKKLILFFVLFLTSCQINVKETFLDFKINQVTQVSLVAVGDNLIHHTIYQSSYINDCYDFKPIFTSMKPYIKQFDLAFINQESILGGSNIGLSSYPLFNSPYEVGDALVDTGFNLISLANNHTLDRGETAIRNSVHYWKQQPVIYSGSEAENTSHVKIFSVNGITFAFVAYTYGTNGITTPPGKEYLVNIYTYEKAKEDLDAIRNEVDVIIVSMHWGREYYNTPSEKQKKQAQELAGFGADIILGHHPHVIEPFDIIKTDKHEAFIIYSLGNFLSDQKGIDRLIGMAFSVEIEKNLNHIKIKYPEARLFYTYKNKGFQNIFFDDLNEFILPDYTNYFINKKNLIQKYTNQIKIT